jgi:hypothetical protein
MIRCRVGCSLGEGGTGEFVGGGGRFVVLRMDNLMSRLFVLELESALITRWKHVIRLN